jgi:hypothetical protein
MTWTPGLEVVKLELLFKGDLPMALCKATLKARECLCKGTAPFYFERRDDFEFRADQFANLTLLNTGRH